MNHVPHKDNSNEENDKDYLKKLKDEVANQQSIEAGETVPLAIDVMKAAGTSINDCKSLSNSIYEHFENASDSTLYNDKDNRNVTINVIGKNSDKKSKIFECKGVVISDNGCGMTHRFVMDNYANFAGINTHTQTKSNNSSSFGQGAKQAFKFFKKIQISTTISGEPVRRLYTLLFDKDNCCTYNGEIKCDKNTSGTAVALLCPARLNNHINHGYIHTPIEYNELHIQELRTLVGGAYPYLVTYNVNAHIRRLNPTKNLTSYRIQTPIRRTRKSIQTKINHNWEYVDSSNKVICSIEGSNSLSSTIQIKDNYCAHDDMKQQLQKFTIPETQLSNGTICKFKLWLLDGDSHTSLSSRLTLNWLMSQVYRGNTAPNGKSSVMSKFLKYEDGNASKICGHIEILGNASLKCHLSDNRTAINEFQISEDHDGNNVSQSNILLDEIRSYLNEVIKKLMIFFRDNNSKKPKINDFSGLLNSVENFLSGVEGLDEKRTKRDNSNISESSEVCVCEYSKWTCCCCGSSFKLKLSSPKICIRCNSINIKPYTNTGYHKTKKKCGIHCDIIDNIGDNIPVKVVLDERGLKTIVLSSAHPDVIRSLELYNQSHSLNEDSILLRHIIKAIEIDRFSEDKENDYVKWANSIQFSLSLIKDKKITITV